VIPADLRPRPVSAPRPRSYSLLLAASHLARGMALVESIFEQEDDEHRIFALCLDEEARVALASVRMPQLVALSVPDIAPGATSLPEVLLALMRLKPSIETLVHLAPERYLVGSTVALASGDVGLEIVRGTPESPIDSGVVVVRRALGGEAAVGRWRDIELGASPRTLDSLEGVRLRVDAASAFGPENFHSEAVEVRAGVVHVDGAPLVSADLVGLRMFSPELFSIEGVATRRPSAAVLGAVVVPYLDALSRAAAWERAVTGQLRGNAEAQTIAIGDELLASRGIRARLDAKGLGARRVELGPVWDAYLAPDRSQGMSFGGLVQRRPPCPRSVPVAASRALPSPRVTALVSTYRAEHVFRGCLEDLVGQTLFAKGELEIVVVDSASPTGELAVALEFAARHPNIVVVRTEEREGVYMAWNRAAALARGRYLTNANTDDRHHPEALERMADVLDGSPGIGLVYADSNITRVANASFGEPVVAGRFRWPDYDRSRLLQGCHVGPQPMWRRDLHDTVGWFDGRYVVAGDYDMWLRFAEHAPLHHLAETLGLYLHRDDSVEHANAERCSNETRSLWALYRLRFERDPRPAVVSPPAPPSMPSVELRNTRPASTPPAAVSGSGLETRSAPAYSCAVVVLVSDREAIAVRSVEALIANTPRYIPYQVVFALRGATSGLKGYLGELGGDVVIKEFASELDVIETWRRAAESAASEVVVLVDGAGTVSEGWLDPLLRALEKEPRNGAVAGRRVRIGASIALARERIGAVAVPRSLLVEVPPVSRRGPGAVSFGDAAVHLFRHLDAGGLVVAQEPRSAVVEAAVDSASRACA